MFGPMKYAAVSSNALDGVPLLCNSINVSGRPPVLLLEKAMRSTPMEMTLAARRFPRKGELVAVVRGCGANVSRLSVRRYAPGLPPAPGNELPKPHDQPSGFDAPSKVRVIVSAETGRARDETARLQTR